MNSIKSIVKKLLPADAGMWLYNARLFMRRFGVRDGLSAYLKFESVKSGLIKVRIPQSKSPIYVRANTSDIPTFYQIFVQGDCEIPLNIDPKFIVDGGANVGYAAVYFANRFPTAEIIAIEPEISNVEVLTMNTASYPQIRVIMAAIWSKNTFLEFEDPNADKWAFRVQASKVGKGSIRTITPREIVDIAKPCKVDIFKLDIEGAEKEVFSAATEWLNSVGVLIVETHDRYEPGCTDALHYATLPYAFTEFIKGENIVLVKNTA